MLLTDYSAKGHVSMNSTHRYAIGIDGRSDIGEALVERVFEFGGRLCVFNTTEIIKIVHEYEEKLGLDYRSDKNEQMAGWDWLKGFGERDPDISLRAPEPTSAARARGFNKPQIMEFFSLLEKVVADDMIQTHKIYNMDESGLNTVQKPHKVFASKGQKNNG
ncbi:hypothetical protein JTB14_023547 [Gonioctena quinquepunctata]|nr:hypothetical protein JTB14_023547 [Gonioctena quinquepunctata]